MCEHMDAAKCMNSEKACQEGDKEGGDDMSMIHCKKVDNDCFKKGEAMGQCKAMEGWMTDGCEDAAKAGSLADKKDPCCTHGTSIMKECYSVECMKLDMEEAVHKAEDADAREKEETEKELGKNFEIGKVCTGLGIPTNKDEIKDGPPAAAGDAASGAWKTFLHAIPCVAMVGGLFA